MPPINNMYMPDPYQQQLPMQPQQQILQPMYQQMMQPHQPPQMHQQMMVDDVIWVQGESAAKSYSVGPNRTVRLWDSEEPVIYIKSADPTGRPYMRILDYTIRGEEQQPSTQVAAAPQIEQDFVSREDLDKLRDSLQRQINRLDSMLNNRNRKEKENG